MHRRLQLVLLALVAILGHSAGALAEDTLSGAAGIAPELNATYTFISATGDDKLFVDTGDKTARVTWGGRKSTVMSSPRSIPRMVPQGPQQNSTLPT